MTPAFQNGAHLLAFVDKNIAGRSSCIRIDPCGLGRQKSRPWPSIRVDIISCSTNTKRAHQECCCCRQDPVVVSIPAGSINCRPSKQRSSLADPGALSAAIGFLLFIHRRSFAWPFRRLRLRFSRPAPHGHCLRISRR